RCPSLWCVVVAPRDSSCRAVKCPTRTRRGEGRFSSHPDGYVCRHGDGEAVIAWAGLETDVAIGGAPLAGGPSTPALAAAVSEAGGVGFLAAGYKTAAAVQAELRELRGTRKTP